jgi:hypothetical protein
MGIAEGTFYRCKKGYSGLESDQLKRTKATQRRKCAAKEAGRRP